MERLMRVFRLEIWKREMDSRRIEDWGEGKYRLGGKGKWWTIQRVSSYLGRWDLALNFL
jgi:hypothetical protein